jgi:hypothetical protein
MRGGQSALKQSLPARNLDMLCSNAYEVGALARHGERSLVRTPFQGLSRGKASFAQRNEADDRIGTASSMSPRTSRTTG